MFKLALSDVLAFCGVILTIILVVLDKAGKLKGRMLLILLAIAALLTLPLVLGLSWVADAQPGLLRFSRGMFMFFLVGLTYSAIAVWVSAAPGPVKQEEPNIVCLGDDDLQLELDRHEVFRESDDSDHALRAVTVAFYNEPNAPRKVGSISNVKPQILYYHLDSPEQLDHRIHRPCRLNEEHSEVSFDLDQVHQLVIGCFEPKRDAGFNPHFLTYENHSDRSAHLVKTSWGHWRGFGITVKLSIGEHGEFSQEHDFELRIDTNYHSFTFEHLTHERKRQRKEYFTSQLRQFVDEGNQLFSKPVTDWTRFYQDAQEWRNKTSALIIEHYGFPLHERLYNVSELKANPHTGAQDDFHTQFLNLQVIANEFD